MFVVKADILFLYKLTSIKKYGKSSENDPYFFCKKSVPSVPTKENPLFIGI